MPDSPFIFSENFETNDNKGHVSKAKYNLLLDRYNVLFEGNFDIVYIHDLKGNIVDMNNSATKILGYSKEELLNMNVLDFIHKEYHEEIKAIFERISVEGSKGLSREYSATTKTGQVIWLNTRSNVLIVEENRKVIVGFAQDVTEQKKYEKNLLKAKKRAEESDMLKSAFLANMSHEIRTPLNAILGFADILANDDLELEQLKSFSGLILKNGEYLLNILSDIIDIAKIESNQIQIKKENFNLTDLLIDVDSTVKNSHNFKSKPGVKFQIEFNADDDIICFTDEVRLKQIIFNLVNNAFKFTAKGKVKVKYYLKDNMLNFVVSDTGSGIKEKYFKKIFERFGQADINNPANYGGTGLGLSICKGMVELLGGEIWMDSQLGIGSNFYFSINIKA